LQASSSGLDPVLGSLLLMGRMLSMLPKISDSGAVDMLVGAEASDIARDTSPSELREAAETKRDDTAAEAPVRGGDGGGISWLLLLGVAPRACRGEEGAEGRARPNGHGGMEPSGSGARLLAAAAKASRCFAVVTAMSARFWMFACSPEAESEVTESDLRTELHWTSDSRGGRNKGVLCCSPAVEAAASCLESVGGLKEFEAGATPPRTRLGSVATRRISGSILVVMTATLVLGVVVGCGRWVVLPGDCTAGGVIARLICRGPR